MADEERTAPVLYGHGHKGPGGPLRIPWSVAERAYSVYSSRYGTGQSLERLCERGGFGPGELDEFVPGWREEASEIARLRAELKRARTEGREQAIKIIQTMENKCLMADTNKGDNIAFALQDLIKIIEECDDG